MIPVKSSGWFNTPLSDDERQLLILAGVLPVNDVYFPLLESEFKIALIYGGRGGGKSEIVADILIDESMESEYFRCYFGRKVFENVRGSCFETLVYCIKKRGLQHRFSFSEANTSTMVITDRKNGNKFLPYGSDKADKLKSIKDPTHIWCEEFDQFLFEDFRELYPALRTKRGKNQLIGTFNTHSVYPNHWLMKVFFPELYQGEEENDFVAVDENMSVLKIFANYTDNLFIDQEQYRQQLKLASGGNSDIFEGLANGAWGIMENNNPWLYAFNPSKHVREVPFLPSFPVYISFDFNNQPFECTAWQFSPNKGGKDAFIHCIAEFSGEFKLDDMCQRIKARFPASILFVTGDRSGQNEDLGRNQTLYQIIAGLLGLNDKQLNLNNTNLEHADSRVMINALLNNYPNIFIDPSCKNLIRQCQIAKPDDKSKKPSELLKDRGIYKMDAFDSLRYFFQTYFNEFAKNAYFRAVKK